MPDAQQPLDGRRQCAAGTRPLICNCPAQVGGWLDERTAGGVFSEVGGQRGGRSSVRDHLLTHSRSQRPDIPPL
jgi:hypothetical protein